MCKSLLPHILFAHVVAETTDVVPSGTILSTTASLAVPARPTASSETVCE